MRAPARSRRSRYTLATGMDLISVECPSCGARLPPKQPCGSYQCEYCNGQFNLEQAKKAQTQAGVMVDPKALAKAILDAQHAQRTELPYIAAPTPTPAQPNPAAARRGCGLASVITLITLAGVLIRTPRHFPNGPDGPGGWTPGGENYVFLSLGHGDTNGPCTPSTTMNLEVKTTVNSNTTLCLSDVSSNDVIIRVARIDTAMIILYRLPGQPWNVHQRYSRPDFPDTLQAGLHCYTDWDKVSTYDVDFYNRNVINANLNPDPSSNPGLPFNPDIIAQFDYARFYEPVVPPNLQGVDLVSQASDADLLSFLSDTLSTNVSDPAAFQLTAAPNPAKDRLQLKWNPQFNAEGYRVLDLQGKVVMEGALETTGGQVLEVGRLAAGAYVLEVAFMEGIIREKILRH